LGPIYGDIFSGLVVEHAMTRSVRDSAALLDATAGPDLGDPYAAPPPARPFLDEISRLPGFLRVAFTSRAATGVPGHPDCVRAVEGAAKLCEDLGHEVTEATSTSKAMRSARRSSPCGRRAPRGASTTGRGAPGRRPPRIASSRLR